MATQNRAAWLDGPRERWRIAPADIAVDGKGEVVIRNRAVAVNPVDCKSLHSKGSDITPYTPKADFVLQKLLTNVLYIQGRSKTGAS
jgi:NADPH:quinone reductase-like Zn-dependent oxidoreductase